MLLPILPCLSCIRSFPNYGTFHVALCTHRKEPPTFPTRRRSPLPCMTCLLVRIQIRTAQSMTRHARLNQSIIGNGAYHPILSVVEYNSTSCTSQEGKGTGMQPSFRRGSIQYKLVTRSFSLLSPVIRLSCVLFYLPRPRPNLSQQTLIKSRSKLPLQPLHILRMFFEMLVLSTPSAGTRCVNVWTSTRAGEGCRSGWSGACAKIMV